MNPKNSDVVLARLTDLHPKVIDLTLERVHRLLERVGHPEHRLPPVIHVAGTNGKGSVIAYMRAAFEQAGLCAHVYTSPHLVRFNERIRLAGKLIDEADLVHLLEECEAANNREPITFFEITTVGALLAFARTPADVVLLETGLGGRLDATNVVKRPALTVITGISIDHQQYLGDTIGQIASEKAGILKAGVPCVVGPQPPEALAAIRNRAAETGCSLIVSGTDWTVERLATGFRVNVDGHVCDYPVPALPGEHQITNAALAAVAVGHTDFAISRNILARGLTAVSWPARFQKLVRGPLVERMPQGWDVWLDGGHNKAAGQVIAAEVRRWRANGDRRPLHLVFGMLNSKDPREFLFPLAELVVSAGMVTIPGEENALPGCRLAELARANGLPGVEAASPEAAFEAAIGATDGPGIILVCGSLHLAGCILAENG